ncbi:hypothetical protein AB0M47_20900 [Hamadaea sp. NPDC051192]|uniref:hypothetical protein n=1 Tax=Hamadaea sp. NPDC051192 TaxID=3154940 RepID=UPI0034405BC4
MHSVAEHNAHRAQCARAAVHTFTAVAAASVDRLPATFGPAVYDMLNDHAYAAMVTYSVATGRGPIILHPGPPPGPDAPDLHHELWAAVQTDAYYVVSDFLCDVRHMLAEHGLWIEDVDGTDPQPQDYPEHAHIEVRMTYGLLTALRAYIEQCHLSYGQLLRASEQAWAEEARAAEAEADTADLAAAADAIAHATPDEIGRAAARLV